MPVDRHEEDDLRREMREVAGKPKDVEEHGLVGGCDQSVMDAVMIEGGVRWVWATQLGWTWL